MSALRRILFAGSAAMQHIDTNAHPPTCRTSMARLDPRRHAVHSGGAAAFGRPWPGKFSPAGLFVCVVYQRRSLVSFTTMERFSSSG